MFYPITLRFLERSSTWIHWKHSEIKKSEKLFKITGIDGVQIKCDSINGRNEYGVREPFLFNFGFDKTPGDIDFSKPLESNSF